ncbi:MAG: hypothetical protein GYB68_14185 [Chloroflexi bacterium]|nr:hypothetical protein [Chloroflexota bacterium]
MIFVDLFLASAVPIFILVAIGFVLRKLIELEIRTLTRLLFYVIAPVVVFLEIVDAELSGGDVFDIILFVVIHRVVLLILALVFFRQNVTDRQRPVLVLGTIFINGGYYGIPLLLLTVGESALPIIIVVILTQTLVLNSAGILYLSAGQSSLRESIGRLASIPLIWAIILGISFGLLQVVLPQPIRVPLDNIRAGFSAIALITIGAQLAEARVDSNPGPISLVTALRLLISPVWGFALAQLLGLTGIVALVLVLSTAFPSAINIFILSKEFEADAELASVMAFWTTLLSLLTVPLLFVLLSG